MSSVNRSFPRDESAELLDIEEKLRAVIVRLDSAGQMLAAAYVELALGVLASEPPAANRFTQFDDPVADPD